MALPRSFENALKHSGQVSLMCAYPEEPCPLFGTSAGADRVSCVIFGISVSGSPGLPNSAINRRLPPIAFRLS